MAIDGNGRNPHRHIPESFLPNWGADDLRSKLRQYDRTPFLDLLAGWLECSPDPEDVMTFAKKNPDKWLAAIAALGKLAGFTEKREVEWTGTLNVREMSDSQIEDMIRKQAMELGLGKMLELEANK